MSTSTHTSSTTSSTGGQDKLAALHEQISDGVAALVESDGWRAMLDTAAKFHSYSLGNLLLIALQARPVRGRGRERGVVAAAHGLDASGYTFAYVAGWAGGDLTCVRQAPDDLSDTA